MSDDRDDYVEVLLGVPPDSFQDKIRRALAVCDQFSSDSPLGPLDEEVLLVAAAAHRQRHNSNLLGLVQRCKQVVKWLTRDPLFMPANPRTRQLLENQSEELARQVANGLFLDEGFILLIFHTGGEGFVAHASSVNRNTQIKMLEEHLGRMKAEQGKQS